MCRVIGKGNHATIRGSAQENVHGLCSLWLNVNAIALNGGQVLYVPGKLFHEGTCIFTHHN